MASDYHPTASGQNSATSFGSGTEAFYLQTTAGPDDTGPGVTWPGVKDGSSDKPDAPDASSESSATRKSKNSEPKTVGRTRRTSRSVDHLSCDRGRHRGRPNDDRLGASLELDTDLRLPALSPPVGARPYCNEAALLTRRSFELERGIRSRDYAIQCLALAQRFDGLPWLQQVRQAAAIAAAGVRRVYRRQPHLFSPGVGGGGNQAGVARLAAAES
jgi:hypothetical protein